ncbi:hypothetical protein LPA44_13935 [Halobacterium sp. KA-4]|uniref:hypothetical protein n=1 Tax=Halobacterium sp. KA-4 TaxID=2896367 RepID=UPI001E2F94BF|nr:hypothetical protein [Halobacterium sp. KA-4]MCD2200986.1 hypothetical protein [Halobacterium sp. KA-4]
MDALGRKIVYADDFLWHLSNVGVGVAVLVATLLYAPPGSYSLDLVVFSIDPFYLLVPLSAVYTAWTGIDFWKWYSGTDNQ